MHARREVLWFWGSSALAAALFAAVAPLLLSLTRLRADTAAGRERVWLATVFCTGMMVLLLGTSSALGVRVNLLRYFAPGPELGDSREREGASAARRRGPYTRNAALWCVSTGAFLVAIYFALWAYLG